MLRQSVFLRSIASAALVVALLACVPFSRAQSHPAPTTVPLPDGWEQVDQRMVFLTIELSTVESSIDATNKALRVNGYQQAVRQAAADNARHGNEMMDRNGGGPVSWKEFYGKTAQQFFYHPDDNTVTVNVNVDPSTSRPPQFDYIYRANADYQQKAEDDAAKIGTKIDDLLDHRRELESEQSALWCKIAFRGVSTLNMAERPLYRMDLTSAATDDAGKQSLEAAKAAAVFMRTINTELTEAQKNIDTDQKAVFDHLFQITSTARADMEARFLQQTSLGADLISTHTAIGRFSKSAKRLEDSAQNMVDALKLAADCSTQGDQTGSQSYRGQLQQMIGDYAASMAVADQALTKAIAEWKVTPRAGSQTVSAPATITTDANANSVEAIQGRLDAAKAANAKDITAAKRALVAAIDTRLNAATDAGDLALVETLQSVKLSARRDGTIPDGTADDAILAAKKQMDQSIQDANGHLIAAYKDAVRDFTRARKITEAQATKDELDALSGTPQIVATPAPLPEVVASPVRTTPDDPATPNAKRFRLHIRAMVDGADELTITDSSARWRHIQYAQPTDITLNGVNLDPQQELDNDGNTAFLNPAAEILSAKVVSRKGRGTIEMTKGNDEIIVKFDDTAFDGADEYDMVIDFQPGLPPNPNIKSAKMIQATLDAAKAASAKEVDAARAALTTVIDTRLLAAAEAGDLALVESLQSAKSSAEDNGTISDDIKDDAVRAAKAQLDKTTETANTQLAATYVAAIRDFNLAKKTAEAQATQDELNANRSNLTEFAKTINLLKMIDIARDSVAGRWQLRDGTLESDFTRDARIEFLYHPPAEYDYKVEFTRTRGNTGVFIICCASGHQFNLEIGTFKNSKIGFSLINGVGEDVNASARSSAGWLENGKKYVCVVKVRKDGVQAFLDGKLITEWKTDFQDMSLAGTWSLHRGDTIGLASNNPTVFHSAGIIEIAGTGERLKD